MNDQFVNENPAEHEIVAAPKSELESRIWSVISFENCVASELTYAEAIEHVARLRVENVPGLCIVTDNAAANVRS